MHDGYTIHLTFILIFFANILAVCTRIESVVSQSVSQSVIPQHTRVGVHTYRRILNRGLRLYFVATYRYNTYRYMARRKENTQINWYTGISMHVRGLLIAYRYTITAVDVHTYILKTLLADNSIIWHPMQQLETR